METVITGDEGSSTNAITVNQYIILQGWKITIIGN